MPEGDTVYKVAAYLDAALRGARVRGVDLMPRFGDSCGPRRVLGVAGEGKHLFITFDGGLRLRSHLGLYGSWHRYRPGVAWRKPAGQASIVIATDDSDYVCFNAKEVQWLRLQGPGGVGHRARVGPDLIRDGVDEEMVAAGVHRHAGPATLLIDLLLDQRIAAGIGNVYKSEVLFLEGLSPFLGVGDIAGTRLPALYRRAAALLADNLGGGPRATRNNLDRRGNLWVYGRGGLPCLRCGDSVQRALLGARPRSTYWCPRCQPRS
ncbi:MAG: Fpg/Nei family DNA glycosylase [Thiohalocapsa sp.]|nr:Fpg/Nei family DNA glycosylase [Thiohalocapsa sp.]